MSTKTANLKLIKPELTDAADITQTNDNWDVIDAELQKRATLDENGKVPEDQLPDTTYIPVTSEVPSDSDIWIDPDDDTVEESHLTNMNNPHGVTAEQIGAASLDENGKVKADQACATVVTPTGFSEYTLSPADMGKMLIFMDGNEVDATTVIIPIDTALTIPIGSEVEISKWNGGLAVTIQTEDGTTNNINIRTRLKNALSQVSIDGSYGVIALKRLTNTKWYVTGDIA